MDIEGKRILITGASGFIGSRLCERLYLEYHANIIALVRNMGKAARIGRLGVEIVQCDILNENRIEKLIKRSDIVIHLAAGDKRTIERGTEIVAKYSNKYRIQKFIHMSSAAVYGLKAKESVISEDVPLSITGNPYSDAKIFAEKIIMKWTKRGLPSVILRPRIVYGPYSSYVLNIFTTLCNTNGIFYLIDEGYGACNTVYIDNLIDAIILSIINDNANNNTFFITDDEQVNWKRFYETFLNMAGREYVFANIESSQHVQEKVSGIEQIIKDVKAFVTSSTMLNFVKEAPFIRTPANALLSYLYSLPTERKMRIKEWLGIPDKDKYIISNYSLPQGFDMSRLQRESGTGYSNIINSRTILGYSPRIDFHTGCELTRQWLKFVKIIGS